jgi:hypothetical protein
MVQHFIMQCCDLPEAADMGRKSGSGKPKKTGELCAKALGKCVLNSPSMADKQMKEEGSISLVTFLFTPFSTT